VTAGKYNDGAKENRAILRDRIYRGMVDAWNATERFAVSGWDWRVEPLRLAPRPEASFGDEASRRDLENSEQTGARRGNAAFQLAWRMRLDRPIEVTCLDLGRAAVLHLPGEPFIEYQLHAQTCLPDTFVCVAGYGDDGPGYLPTKDAYWQGGYEPTVALTDPSSEATLHAAMAEVMKK